MIKIKFWERRVYWYKCFACFAALVAEGFIDNAKGILLPDVKFEKGIDYSLYSFLPNAMLIGYVIFSLLSASIIYKFGYRWTFIIGYVGPLIGFLGIYLVNDFYMLVLFLFIASAGLGSLDLCSHSLGTVTFDSHIGLMFCLLAFFYGIGSFLAPPYIKLWYYLCPSFGYKEQYLVAMIPIGILFIPTLFVPFNKDIKTNLEYKKLENEEKEEIKEKPKKSSPFKVLFNVRLWTIILLTAFATITERSTSNWGVLYAIDYLHVNQSKASDFFTYFLMFYTFSRLITGFIIDKFGSINTLILLEICTLICASIGFSVTNSNVALWFLSFTGLFVSTFWPTFMKLIVENFKIDSETATGFILPFQCVIQIGVMYAFGVINDSFGNEYAYILSYASTGFALLITILLFVFMRIERKQNQKDEENVIVL